MKKIRQKSFVFDDDRFPQEIKECKKKHSEFKYKRFKQ